MVLFPIIFVFIVLNSSQNAQAGVWGETIVSTIWKQASEEIAKNLRAAITGALKQGVAQIMNTQISMMVGGGNGKGVQFITNWQTFLVADPQKQTNAYMNDFFSMTTRGRNSYGNYRGVAPAGQPIAVLTPEKQSWFAQEGIIPTAQAAPALVNADVNSVNAYDANFYKYQNDTARKAINPSTPNIDLMDYVSGPSDIFTRGSWRGFNAFFSNPANNPLGYSLLAEEAYQSKYDQERHKADIQAVAYQGFKASVGSDGFTVKTPGITIGQLVNKVQGFSFDSISSAQDWGMIISSMATGVISAATTAGINAAQNAVQSGLDKATGSLATATGGLLNFNLNANSLANIDWGNNGQSAEFNNGINNFNADTQSNLTGSNQVWGDMNFAGANVGGGANISNKNSYSPLDEVNFESLAPQPTFQKAQTFIPDTTWTVPVKPQSNDPLWVPTSGN